MLGRLRTGKTDESQLPSGPGFRALSHSSRNPVFCLQTDSPTKGSGALGEGRLFKVQHRQLCLAILKGQEKSRLEW